MPFFLTKGLARWRQEARNNGSADLKVSCAAGRVVEAATSPSRLPVIRHVGTVRTALKQTTLKTEENLKTEKVFKLNSSRGLFCSVRYAHTTKQTPRKKMANAIIWLCQPTTQSEKINIKKQFVGKQKFKAVEKLK